MTASDFTRETITVRMPIDADVDTVWSFLADPERFASWIGAFAGGPPQAGTTIEPRVGGTLRVVFPHSPGAACGEFVEIVDRQRVVFTWGYEDGANGMLSGSSTVELRLSKTETGSLVELIHRGVPTPEARAGHRGGWLHYLAMLALRGSGAQHAGRLPALVADFFAAWATEDDAQRGALLQRACRPDVSFRSRFARTDDVDALNEHIAGGRRHMPELSLVAGGPVQSLHAFCRVPWALIGPAANTVMRGVYVIQLALDSRLAVVTSFTDAE